MWERENGAWYVGVSCVEEESKMSMVREESDVGSDKCGRRSMRCGRKGCGKKEGGNRKGEILNSGSVGEGRN